MNLAIGHYDTNTWSVLVDESATPNEIALLLSLPVIPDYFQVIGMGQDCPIILGEYMKGKHYEI